MCPDALWNLSIKREITCKWQNYSFFSNKCAPLRVTSNAKYNESELCKTVRLTSFQNPQLQSFWIFFNFIHPCLLFHLHDYLYLLLLFWAVIFLFHSILGWFSNRTGTSVDNGARKSNNWLDQWQSGKLGTGSLFSPFRVLSRRQLTFPSSYLNQPNLVAVPTTWILINSVTQFL